MSNLAQVTQEVAKFQDCFETLVQRLEFVERAQNLAETTASQKESEAIQNFEEDKKKHLATEEKILDRVTKTEREIEQIQLSWQKNLDTIKTKTSQSDQIVSQLQKVIENN